jgi:hypothetical protein
MRRLRTLFATAALITGAVPAPAQLIVDALVTPLGGSVRYDITVNNNTAEDISIVTILDAPLLDPLIDPSLIAPPGFLADYDDALGLIAFLEDADLFGVASSVSGFSFESMATPEANFTSFEALSVLGNTFTGSIRITPADVIIPESGTSLAAAGVLLCLGWQTLRRFRSRC